MCIEKKEVAFLSRGVWLGQKEKKAEMGAKMLVSIMVVNWLSQSVLLRWHMHNHQGLLHPWFCHSQGVSTTLHDVYLCMYMYRFGIHELWRWAPKMGKWWKVGMNDGLVFYFVFM